jgi:F-type H+-transporting ATPase subunit a
MASDPTPVEPSQESTPAGAPAPDTRSASEIAAAAAQSAIQAAADVESAAETATLTTAQSIAQEESAIEAELADEVALATAFKQEVAAEVAAEQEPLKEGLGVRLRNNVQANPMRWGVIGGVVALLIIGIFIPVPQPHVALGGEPINSNVPSWLTNSMLTTFIVDILLIILALGTYFSMKMVPSGLQNVMEAIIEYFWGLAEQISGKAARTYFPWIMTIFLFVIFANWTGLIPGVGSIGWVQIHEEEHAAANQEAMADRLAGQLAMADGKLVLLQPDQVAAALQQEPVPTEAGTTEQHAGDEHAATEESTLEETVAAEHFIPLFRAPSADLNMTFALALITMTLVQIYGFRALGFSYLQKFFTLRGTGFMKGVNAYVGILELISEVSRILSFGFRLFGNIFAGEIVLATMAFLMAFVLPLPFYILEVFVGFVQALVWAMLALVFFTLSTHSHAEHAHDEAHDAAHADAHGVEPVAAGAH